jgi:hypothetical protein
MPQPSEGLHYALDCNQPPTQANISISTIETYQNGKAIIYSQPFLGVPLPQITSCEQRQAAAQWVQARKRQIYEQCVELAELQHTVNILCKQER